MKIDVNGKHALVSELESANQNVSTEEPQLEKFGENQENETEQGQTISDLQISEVRYRRLFETAQDGILILDADTGKIVDVNPFLLNLLGFTKQEFLGQPLWEAGAFHDTSDSKIAFKELQQNKYIRYEDLPLKTKDGQLIAVEFVSNVYLVGSQKVIQCNIRDITDRKRAEKALIKERNLLHTLIDALPDRIFAKDIDGKFVLNNAAHLKALGVNSQEEALGKTDYDFRPQEFADRYSAGDKQVIREGKALINLEEPSITSSGEIGWMLSTKVPLHDPQGKIIGLVGNGRDITERKKLQQELVQSQKMQSIGVLAGGIAHDFNNILGIILGYASLIEKNGLSYEKHAEAVAAINQAVQRGAALVRQILTFARKTDVSFEPLNLRDLFQELFSMLEQTFPKIIIFKKIFPNDIPFILADRTQIHQALLNLCVNARDAMPNGGSITIKEERQTGKQLRERFSTADQEMYIRISVTDTGEGMSEATRCKVFEPFFTTKEKGKGTGLGLSVVYGIMQAHRGFIDVESECGQGTTFNLYFPLPDISQILILNESRNMDTYEPGGTETVLVVEDEEYLLNTVCLLLKSKGYNVFSAQDGKEAINIYKKHGQEIDLVLTDLGLPSMTGMEEFNQLQEINPSVLVVFASGYFEPDMKAKLQKSGAAGFLQKPFLSDDVLMKIRKAFDGRKEKGFHENL